VPLEQLPKTLEKFMKEYAENNLKLKSQGEKSVEVNQASDIAEAAKLLFEAWKTQRKKLEKQSGTTALSLEKELEQKFGKQDTIKHITGDMDVKTLAEIAKRLTQQPGRLLVMANITGEKVNIIVASSSKQNAGEICRKICLKQGGGGGGNQTLAMGGGNAKEIEKILDEFKV
jgi:alanyl-tRNA synthetase